MNPGPAAPFALRDPPRERSPGPADSGASAHPPVCRRGRTGSLLAGMRSLTIVFRLSV